MTQDVTDFVATLAHSSLAVARPNKLKPGSAPTFYAEVCFPPEAANVLAALASTVAPGGSLAGLEIGVKTNAQKAKPIPGIPHDWYVVKSSTQFAPYVADATGAQIVQGSPEANARIQAVFFAGKRVRASLSAFAWSHAQTGRRGVSFNLTGIMEAGDGERLNIGSGVTANAFAKYAQPGGAPAAQPAAGNPFAAQAPAPQVANPLAVAPVQQPAQVAAPAVSANPFAQQAPAQAANPFAR